MKFVIYILASILLLSSLQASAIEEASTYEEKAQTYEDNAENCAEGEITISLIVFQKYKYKNLAVTKQLTQAHFSFYLQPATVQANTSSTPISIFSRVIYLKNCTLLI